MRQNLILLSVLVFNFAFGQTDQQPFLKRYNKPQDTEFTTIPLTTCYVVTNSRVRKQPKRSGWVSSQTLESKEKTKTLIINVRDSELSHDLQIVFEIAISGKKINIKTDTLRSTLRLINHYALKSINPEKHLRKYLRKIYTVSHLDGQLTIEFEDLVIINGTVEIISKHPSSRQVIDFKNYRIKEVQIKELLDIEQIKQTTK